MGTYAPGDVLLVRVRLPGKREPKTRPVVVRACRPGGFLDVVPVTSRFPVHDPCLPLAPGDFRDGGLDICDESYVLFGITVTVKTGEIIGKKGRLTAETMAAIGCRKEG
jgi:mRNA interferase MazF